MWRKATNRKQTYQLFTTKLLKSMVVHLKDRTLDFSRLAIDFIHRHKQIHQLGTNRSYCGLQVERQIKTDALKPLIQTIDIQTRSENKIFG